MRGPPFRVDRCAFRRALGVTSPPSTITQEAFDSDPGHLKRLVRLKRGERAAPGDLWDGGSITRNVSEIEKRSRPRRTGLRCGRELQQLAIRAVGEHVHGTVLEHPNIANALVQVPEERFLVDDLVVLT